MVRKKTVETGIVDCTEQKRLNEAREEGIPWKKWGPYLSERQWGTVREDYSADGNAWDYFTHDQSRSRAYRWGEDGLGGISDDQQRLCFALALWNGRDPILKERMFGLTNSEGNHGEDVKEYYFYLDSTPTHSYMKHLYKYPQREFPYRDLLETNRGRSREEMEYELLDTGVFDDDRYFDVFLEYAKAGPEDILIKVSVHNRGPEAARLHLLPTLWFRNTWSWGDEGEKPVLREAGGAVVASHPGLGDWTLRCDGDPELLFTENESNVQKLWGQPNPTPYVKDAFHRYVVSGERDAVNPGKTGTKAAARYVLDVPAGGSQGRPAPPLRGPGRRAVRPGVRGDVPAAALRRRRVLRPDHPPRADRGRTAGPPAGARRDALVEAVLLLRPRPVAEGARGPSALRRREPRRPERRVVPHAERRRHLHARQVGVPVVRGVGPGLPHDRALARRLRLREGAAPPDAPEPLRPPERADPGVRVELQRREPPRARLGDAVPPQVREEPRPRGRQVPGALLPGPDAELQLVGEPEGPAGPERLRRRVPRPRQHRRLRPERAAPDRRVPRAGGRDRLDGLLLPEHARDGPHPRRPRPGLRGARLQVPRELHLDLLRHGQGRRARGRHVGREGRLLLRRSPAAGRRGVPAEGPLDGGAPAALREHDVRRGPRQAPSEAPGADRDLQEAPPRGARARRPDRGGLRRLRGAPAPLAPHPDEARARPRHSSSTRRSSSAPTASAPSRASTSRTRSSSTRAARSIASITSPRSPTPGCSGETRTGGGRSGCRSTC